MPAPGKHCQLRGLSIRYGKVSNARLNPVLAPSRASKRNPTKETTMSVEFLSDEWFAKVKEIRESAGDVEAPAALADMKPSDVM